MPFQDDLLRNMRTKEEAEAAHNDEMRTRAAEQAQYIYSDIKEALVSTANEGKFDIIDNKKIVSCTVLLPDCFYFDFKLIDKSIYIPATPTNLERHLQEIMQAAPRNRKAIAKKCRGMDLSGGGKPAEYHRCVCFDVDITPESENDYVIRGLKQQAQFDSVSVELCVCDKYTKEIYPIGIDFKDISTSKFDYILSVKCSAIIPETYSSDVAIQNEIIDTSRRIDIDNMEGHEFEHFCADLLSKNGYSNIEVTKGSGDQGIDIIAFKDGIKFGIQCKCYTADIGNTAVQEAYSGKTYYNCHVGVVLTNRYFTRSAIELAKKNGVLLWDRTKLTELISKAGL